MRRLRYPQNEIVDAIQDCINNDPYRAEAYFELSHHYCQFEQWETAWKFAKIAMNTKRPTDKLFIVEDYT